MPFGAPVIFGLGVALSVQPIAYRRRPSRCLRSEPRWSSSPIISLRPILIGGAARLPFLWVLLGIFGGLETFGLLGLFLGPTIMATLLALWREWAKPSLA